MIDDTLLHRPLQQPPISLGPRATLVGGQFPYDPNLQPPQQQNILQRMSQAMGRIDPMTLSILGANLLAANRPMPGNVGAGARLGMAMQNALPQIQGFQSLKQQREDRKNLIDENTRIAKNILANQDVDQDGRITPLERQIAEKARLVIANPLRGTEVLNDIYNLRAQIATPAPPEKVGEVRQQLLSMGLVPGTPEWNAKLDQWKMGAGTSVTINQGDKQLGDLALKMQNEANEHPPPNMTIDQAVASGYELVTPEQRKSRQAAEEALPLIGDTIKFGLGDPEKPETSLFPPDTDDLWDRLESGGTAKWHTFTQDPNHPDLILYNDNRNATLTGLSKVAGQVGQLTDRDVQLVAELWPKPGFTPHSVAIIKFQQILRLLRSKGVPESMVNEFFGGSIQSTKNTTPGPSTKNTTPPSGFRILKVE